MIETAEGDVRLIGRNDAVQRRKIVGVDEIVGIDETHIFSPRRLQPGIARRRDAAVFLLPQHLKRTLAGTQNPFGDRARRVGRSVVDKNDLQTGITCAITDSSARATNGSTL